MPSRLNSEMTNQVDELTFLEPIPPRSYKVFNSTSGCYEEWRTTNRLSRYFKRFDGKKYCYIKTIERKGK